MRTTTYTITPEEVLKLMAKSEHIVLRDFAEDTKNFVALNTFRTRNVINKSGSATTLRITKEQSIEYGDDLDRVSISIFSKDGEDKSSLLKKLTFEKNRNCDVTCKLEENLLGHRHFYRFNVKTGKISDFEKVSTVSLGRDRDGK